MLLLRCGFISIFLIVAFMESFKFTLPDGTIISGLQSLPAPSSDSSPRPLVIALHGGTYDASYYNSHPALSISTLSHALNVPIIIPHRQGYGTTTPLSSIPQNSTNMQEQARNLNSTIIPALYNEYALKTGATSVVLFSHSIGAAIAIITAALHARTEAPSWPLSGLVVTGLGFEWILSEVAPMDVDPAAGTALWDNIWKNNLMLNPSLHQAAAPLSDSGDRTAALNVPIPLAELEDIAQHWATYWTSYAADVTCPVLHMLGRDDQMWRCTDENVQRFLDAFPKSIVRQGMAIPHAPHCVELSIMAEPMMVKALAFAMESAVGERYRRELVQNQAEKAE